MQLFTHIYQLKLIPPTSFSYLYYFGENYFFISLESAYCKTLNPKLFTYYFEGFEDPFAVAELEVVGAGGILPDLEGGEVVSDEDALQEFALAVEEVSLQAVHRDLKTVEHQLCEILGGVGEHHGVEGDLRVGVDAHCLDLVGLLDTFGHGNGSVAVGGRLRDDLADGVADTSGAALRVTAHGHNRGLPHDACT